MAEKFSNKEHLIIHEHKVNKYHNKLRLYINKITERIGYIKKCYVQHWALKGLSNEFKVNCLSNWNLHPTNVSDIITVKKNYKVLVDSIKGPIVIEHNNTLATQFLIDITYPSTLIILSNFFKRYIGEVEFEDINESRNNKQRISKSFTGNNANCTIYTNKFFHTGLSYPKKRGIYVASNNAITKNSLNVKVSYRNSDPDEESPLKTHHKPKLTKLEEKDPNKKCKTLYRFVKTKRLKNMIYSTIDNALEFNKIPEIKYKKPHNSLLKTCEGTYLKERLLPPFNGFGKCLEFSSSNSSKKKQLITNEENDRLPHCYYSINISNH